MKAIAPATIKTLDQEVINVVINNNTSTIIPEDVAVPRINFGAFSNTTSVVCFRPTKVVSLENVCVAYHTQEKSRSVWVADLRVSGCIIDINKLHKYTYSSTEAGYTLYKDDVTLTTPNQVGEFLRAFPREWTRELGINLTSYLSNLRPILKDSGWSEKAAQLYIFSSSEKQRLVKICLEIGCQELALKALAGSEYLYPETIEAIEPLLEESSLRLLPEVKPLDETRFNFFLLEIISQRSKDMCPIHFSSVLNLLKVRPGIESFKVTSSKDVELLSTLGYYSQYLEEGDWGKYSLQELAHELATRAEEDLF